MKKITLSVALLASVLAMKAQDTICTMVRPHEVVEFNFQTSKVVSRYDNKKVTIIEVGYQEILCLHLYDEKHRIRKVITTLANGKTIVQVLDSKDNTYYTSLGTTKVEVRRSRLMILR
jgi:GH15 family glucan-1,4-alpha-glucosidase